MSWSQIKTRIYDDLFEPDVIRLDIKCTIRVALEYTDCTVEQVAARFKLEPYKLGAVVVFKFGFPVRATPCDTLDYVMEWLQLLHAKQVDIMGGVHFKKTMNLIKYTP